MAAYLPKSCRQFRLPCRLLESLHWLELVGDITFPDDDFLDDKSCDFGCLETVVLGVEYLPTFLVVVLVTFLSGDAFVETVVLAVEYLIIFLGVVLRIPFFTVVVSGEFENFKFGRFDVLYS